MMSPSHRSQSRVPDEFGEGPFDPHPYTRAHAALSLLRSLSRPRHHEVVPSAIAMDGERAKLDIFQTGVGKRAHQPCAFKPKATHQWATHAAAQKPSGYLSFCIAKRPKRRDGESNKRRDGCRWQMVQRQVDHERTPSASTRPISRNTPSASLRELKC